MFNKPKYNRFRKIQKKKKMSSNDETATTQTTATTGAANREKSQTNVAHNPQLDSPIRGPTLSTSTSSFEALDPHDPNLSKLATKMFRKTEEYISNELQAPIEDYQLLENMNRATIAKYSDMRQISQNLSVSTAELSVKFQALVSYLNNNCRIDYFESNKYLCKSCH